MDCPIQYSYSSAGVGGIWSFMKIGGGRTSGSEGRCLNHQNAIKQSAKLPIKLKYPQIKVPKMQRSNTKPPFWTSPRNKKRIQRFCDVLVVYRWGLHNFKKTVKHIFIVSSLAQQIHFCWAPLCTGRTSGTRSGSSKLSVAWRDGSKPPALLRPIAKGKQGYRKRSWKK